MIKAIFFIDGFNLYHSLANSSLSIPKNYKWLDLHKLCCKFLGTEETLVEIYYFTSLCSWNNDKANRHKQYIEAQKNSGVKVIFGNFKEVTRKCRATCKEFYRTFEEKRTDVSIGIKMLSLASSNKFDIAYLISADSDLIPAIEEIGRLNTNKKIIPIFPFGKGSLELKKVCGTSRKIKEFHMAESLLDDNILCTDGSIISCPTNWIPIRQTP